MKDTPPKFTIHGKEDITIDDRVERRLKTILTEFNETGELNKADMYDLVKFITLFYPSKQKSPEEKDTYLIQ